MQLSIADIIDIFFRFLVVGQLSILSIYALSKYRALQSVLAAMVTVCLSAYLLLTAPIADEHYGILRGMLLFFTELTPYILWCFAFSLLNDNFHPKHWPTWGKTSIFVALIWFLYFFGYLQGRGAFHQVNHVLELCLLLHIIFISIKDLADDLVAVRRKIRLLFVLYTCIYLSTALVLELGDSSLRDSSLFSTLNALLILLATTAFSFYLFNDKFKDETAKTSVDGSKEEDICQAESELEIPLVYQDYYGRLCQLMSEGVYTETQLTISQLASKLKMPEHQLRELINKHLGFRNFSEFLNGYRLPAACSALEDVTNIRKPILTIALELGYGSIATFNRAFKAKIGKTPKEYRNYFHK